MTRCGDAARDYESQLCYLLAAVDIIAEDQPQNITEEAETSFYIPSPIQTFCMPEAESRSTPFDTMCVFMHEKYLIANGCLSYASSQFLDTLSSIYRQPCLNLPKMV